MEKTKEITPVKTVSMRVTADIDNFLSKRKEFIEKVNAIMVETKDYHIIKDKKSLAKGGAEKIASIFHWQAKFTKDDEALQMLGQTEGLVAFKCTLETKGKFIGEGRGAASLKGNAGDPNKTLKMAQKSAYIDAVIRASGLSDFFTQDLEDMPAQSISQPFVKPPTVFKAKAEPTMSDEMPICPQHNKKMRWSQNYGYSCPTPVSKDSQGNTIWCDYQPPLEEQEGQDELSIINQDLEEEAKLYM